MSRHLWAARGCLNHLEAGSGVDYQSTGLTRGTELLPHPPSKQAQTSLNTATNTAAELPPAQQSLTLAAWKPEDGSTRRDEQGKPGGHNGRHPAGVWKTSDDLKPTNPEGATQLQTLLQHRSVMR